MNGIDYDKNERWEASSEPFDAQKLWDDPGRIEIPTNFLDEPRYILIGKINNKHLSAIFPYRNKKIRLISVRRAGKNEKEIYES